MEKSLGHDEEEIWVRSPSPSPVKYCKLATFVLAKSVQWGALKVGRLQSLLEDRVSERWTSLFNIENGFDATVEIRSALEKLLEEVRRRN